MIVVRSVALGLALGIVLGAGVGHCQEMEVVLGRQSVAQVGEALPDTQDLPLVLSVPDPAVPVVDKPVKVKPMKYSSAEPPPPPTQAKSKKDLKLREDEYRSTGDATGITVSVVQNKTWPKPVRWPLTSVQGAVFPGPIVIPPGKTAGSIRGKLKKVSEPTTVNYVLGGWRVTSSVTVQPKKK